MGFCPSYYLDKIRILNKGTIMLCIPLAVLLVQLSAGMVDKVPMMSDTPGSPMTLDGSRASDEIEEIFNDFEVNPLESPDLFEGDIMLPNSSMQRNAVLHRSRRWENAIIPYKIANHFTQDEINIIYKAI